MGKIGVREIAAVLAEKRKLDADAAQRFVEALFEVLLAGLAGDKAVKIKGLGTFKVIPVSARKSVDVNTGEAIEIAGREKITFTPDATLRDIVNRPFAQFETVEVGEGVDFSEIDARMGVEASADDGEVMPAAAEPPVQEQSEALPAKMAQAIDDIAQAMSLADEPQAELDEPADTEPSADIAPATDPAQTVEEVAHPEIEGPSVSSVDKRIDTTETEPPASVSGAASAEKMSEPVHPITTAQPEPLPTAQPSAVPSSEQTDMLRMQNEHLAEANEMLRDQLQHSRRMLHVFGWTLGVCLLFCLGCACFLGIQLTRTGQPAAQPPVANHPVTTVAPAATKPKAAAKPAAPDTMTSAPVDSHPSASAASKAVTTESSSAQSAAEPTSAQTQYDADPRVRTGAYVITGIKTSVRVRAGQTLSSISKTYLGPGMECYVEAVNGTREVSEGQMVKIPELRLRHKRHQASQQ